jgi:hypothetical protein
MAYYDALVAKWGDGTLTGTTDQKLAAINALGVAGPKADVPVSIVVGRLMLSGAYLTLAAFAKGATNGTQTHDDALTAAQMLMALITTPNAPAFATSDPADYATIKGMMDAVLAQEVAQPGSTGFTQAVHDGLLSLAETSIPWWQANGYTSPFNANDLAAAGVS